jgi:hypothetical protein
VEWTARLTRSRRNWRATVTITIVDANGVAVADANVHGDWSGGTGGAGSCVTGLAGTCSVTSSTVSGRKPSVTFTVTGVSGASLTYDPAANLITAVTISAP